MGGTRIIVAGGFIDGTGADVRRNVFLAVKDATITAIGSVADLRRYKGNVVDDLSHCTVLPALVDCSVSLLRSPSVSAEFRRADEKAEREGKAAMLERHIDYFHAHGVLGVADCGAPLDLMERYREQGAPTGKVEIRTCNFSCRSGQEGVTGLPAGGDFIKIGYSENIEDEEAQKTDLTREGLSRLLKQCKGKKVVVVANGRQRVAEALAAGCDAIEQGFGMGKDNLSTIAKKKILWIPGVVRAKNSLDGVRSGGDVCCRFSTRYVAPGKPLPGAEDFWKKVLAEQLAQLRLARQLGVKAAIGTGAGGVGILHGESMVEEIKLFIKAGYSLEETIRCASENGAGFFGMTKAGALKVGRNATFLVTRGTAKQLPRKLAYLEGIYVDGEPSGAYRKNPVKPA